MPPQYHAQVSLTHQVARPDSWPAPAAPPAPSRIGGARARWRRALLALLLACGAAAAGPGGLGPAAAGAWGAADDVAAALAPSDVPADALHAAAPDVWLEAAPEPAPAVPPALVPTALELELLARVNADRAAHGVPPVALDPDTLGVARARAADQVALPRLSHYDASGALVFERLLTEARVGYTMIGENLARLTGAGAAAAERAEAALMASPSHRANILNPRYTRLAVGATTSETGQLVLAQIFRATA